MNKNNLNQLAYLNSLNKKPQDMLMELIQLESYPYEFAKKGATTISGENINEIILNNYKIRIDDAIFNRFIDNNFKILDRKLVTKNIMLQAELDNLVQSMKTSEKLFLEKVSSVRDKFIRFANDKYNKKINKEAAKDIFDNYIYSVAKEEELDNTNAAYFIFKQFLFYCFDRDRESLKIIEDFGIANEIQYLVINDFENNPKFLDGCTIFIDTPILMRRLGYDGLSFYNDYTAIFERLIEAGATLKIFEHTFEELWGILFNFKKSIAQNILDAQGVDTFLKARKEFIDSEYIKEADKILSLENRDAVKKNIEYALSSKEERKEKEEERKKGIIIYKHTEDAIISYDDNDIADVIDDNYQAWKFDTEKFKELLVKNCPNLENYPIRIDRDIDSISAVSRRRIENNVKNSIKLKDYKYFLLVDNHALIRTIQQYYENSEKKQYYNELLLENTLLFSLWQNLSYNDEINRRVFRSKCFAMNAIDDQFKDKLYRETRRLETYTNLNVSDVLIYNPSIVDATYEDIIQDEKYYDEQYIAHTVKNKIKNETNKLKDILANRDQKLKEIIEQKNLGVKKAIDSNVQEIEDIESRVRQENIENLANRLSKKPINKFCFFVKKFFCKLFNKPFDTKQYFLEKARKMLS